MLDLSISIVSTNERHFIEKLLPTLYADSSLISKEIILIDNASSDDLEAVKKPEYTNLSIIRNNKKLSFCTNHNIGIEASKGRYILVLNPDILFPTDEFCLSKMVKFMDENPECGVSGCGVYHYDNTFAYPARKFIDPLIILSRRLPFLFNTDKVMDRYLYRNHDIHDTFECDWLSGCFLLFKEEIVRKIGGFDDCYDKYFEDVDICHRIAQANMKVMYHGETYYYHFEQRDSKKMFSKDARIHLQSYFRWIKKTGLVFSP